MKKEFGIGQAESGALKDLSHFTRHNFVSLVMTHNVKKGCQVLSGAAGPQIRGEKLRETLPITELPLNFLKKFIPLIFREGFARGDSAQPRLGGFDIATFKYFEIFHYSISQSYDIDFVVQTKKPVLSKRGEVVLIEVKYGKKFRKEWIKGIDDFRKLSKETVKGAHVLYTGTDRLQVEGVEIWPASSLLEALFEGHIIG